MFAGRVLGSRTAWTAGFGPKDTDVRSTRVTVTTTETQGCTLMTVAGELDIYTAPRLEEAISRADSGRHLRPRHRPDES